MLSVRMELVKKWRPFLVDNNFVDFHQFHFSLISFFSAGILIKTMCKARNSVAWFFSIVVDNFH